MRRGLALAVASFACLMVSAVPPVQSAPEPTSIPAANSLLARNVVAFYYGWFGNPKVDGEWMHWNDPRLGIRPPGDISSDYYPQLGAYSTRDPAVLRQHMRWLRLARVGVIALSWWAGETPDSLVSQILDAAKSAGIKVTLHIEPATGRTAATYQADVIRLVRTFGKHPAFFTTTKGGPHMKGGSPRPLIFVWATALKDLAKAESVPPSYWAGANDAIRRKVGALVVACPCGGGYADAVTEGRFDGAYNYATLHLEEEGGFDWARSLPPGALYIPSVMPGNHADRIGYPSDTIVPRRGGREYDDQWTAALGTGITPDLVSITSFNEWHEGSQIEPARVGYAAGGRKYLDFSPLSPTAYLDQTARWVAAYAAGDYPRPRSTPVRVTVETSSDWVALKVTDGAFARPREVEESKEATRADFDGSIFAMNQSLVRAQSGLGVSMTYEAVALGDAIVVQGRSGHIGTTRIRLEAMVDGGWMLVSEASWVGGVDDGATRSFVIS
jgi:glycoprotein endo-alpha-1,2-mannosidase